MTNLNLTVERVFDCDAKTLYSAISEGMLLKSCGCNTDKLVWDFKVGGKYKSSWDGECGDTYGEFLELNEFDKIVFTWKYISSVSKEEANTTVKVSIKEEGEQSFLSLFHEGFQSQEAVDDHHQGWTEGIETLQKNFK